MQTVWRALSATRPLGVAALAGCGAGIAAAGLGGRLVMRVVALTAGPDAVGRLTANGNRVGDITVGGTLALVIFEGIFSGLVGGLVYLAVRPWLLRLGQWRGIGFGLAALALMGSTVFEPTNPDFQRFGLVPLNVALFASLFFAFGVLVSALYERLDRAAEHHRAADVSARAAAVPAGLVIVMGTASTAAAFLSPGPDSRPLFGVLLLSTRLAGLVGRRLLRRSVLGSYGLVALPFIAGLAITARDLALVLR